jgi:tagatose 1,6-diphosphate aldolase
VFTTAQRRALDQLSTASGRLAVVAADQRTKLRAARDGAGLPADDATLLDVKLDLVRSLAPHAPAMLLDPEIGLPGAIDSGAFPARTGLVVSLERSGAVRTADGLRRAELLPEVGAAGVRRLGGTAAKLLVRLRPDREDVGGENGRVIRAAVADCAAHDLLLVVEALVYRLDDEEEGTFRARRAGLIRGAAELAEACGAPHLKLEYPGDLAGCEAITAALGVPWALLSAGVDHDTFVGQLRDAIAGGASGFIAGRSIWKECVVMDAGARRAFLAGEARRRLSELLALVQ